MGGQQPYLFGHRRKVLRGICGDANSYAHGNSNRDGYPNGDIDGATKIHSHPKDSTRAGPATIENSSLFVSDSVLDYSDDLQKGGFKVANPNAVANCSCGESFAV